MSRIHYIVCDRNGKPVEKFNKNGSVYSSLGNDAFRNELAKRYVPYTLTMRATNEDGVYEFTRPMPLSDFILGEEEEWIDAPPTRSRLRFLKKERRLRQLASLAKAREMKAKYREWKMRDRMRKEALNNAVLKVRGFLSAKGVDVSRRAVAGTLIYASLDYDDLAKVSERDWLKYRGCGRKALKEIHSCQAVQGLSDFMNGMRKDIEILN